MIDDSFEHEVWYPATEEDEDEDEEKEGNVFFYEEDPFLDNYQIIQTKSKILFRRTWVRTPAPRVLRNIKSAIFFSLQLVKNPLQKVALMPPPMPSREGEKNLHCAPIRIRRSGK